MNKYALGDYYIENFDKGFLKFTSTKVEISDEITYKKFYEYLNYLN